MVAKRRGSYRKSEMAVSGQIDDVIVVHGTKQRRSALFPVRHQFGKTAGVHDRSGDDVRPDLLPFFEDRDRRVFHQLPQVISGSQARGSAPNDQNVNLKLVSFGH